MKRITLDLKNIQSIVSENDINRRIKTHREFIESILHPQIAKSAVLGWIDLDQCANEALLSQIEAKAEEVRENADILLLIGVGGSNQGGRAAIKAFQTDGKPEILYAGNSLAPFYMNRILEQMKGKSVYANVIAKNFATLEPGICFRMIRKQMEAAYGTEQAAERIIATGSPRGGSLEKLAATKGYSFFTFPLDIGGRFSVMSAVGLLPMAIGRGGYPGNHPGRQRDGPLYSYLASGRKQCRSLWGTP